MLYETWKLGTKPCSTTMAPNIQLTKKEELFKDLERYRRVVRKLNYLIVTCTYIAYLVNVLSQYMSFPTVSHWAYVEHILLEKKPLDVEHCIRSISIQKLSAFQTQTRHELRKIGNPT